MINESKKVSRFALGSAQFGLDYGISNYFGQVKESLVVDILTKAKNNNINTIDTAMIYGGSESILGRIGVRNFNVITKLPPIPQGKEGNKIWVANKINSSKKKLNVNKLYGLLLHKSSDFLGPLGDSLYSYLQELKQDQIINKIGVSIYSPRELDILADNAIKIDIVQAPFNIFDRRLKTSGWIDKLNNLGIEIHVRSIFLQGLLLLSADKRNKYFDKWKHHFDKFEKWTKDTNQKPLEACLNFVHSCEEIDKIIVGIENLKQLEEILSVKNDFPHYDDKHLIINDNNLINPSYWRLN